MTKNVRVENADTSDYTVAVKAQDRNAAGEWVDAPVPATLLSFPTQMTSLTIWAGRRYVIEEAPKVSP